MFPSIYAVNYAGMHLRTNRVEFEITRGVEHQGQRLGQQSYARIAGNRVVRKTE
jgi:hypothetical protein